MQRRTFVHIVCSPAQRAGVTTTARLFADYHQNLHKPFIGFDTDPHGAPFAARFPEEVQKADLAVIRDQVSLFDRLLVHDELPKILDLGGRDFTRFFTIASETGFFEEARRLSIEPVLFYCIDETTATLETARRINREWPELMLVFVANEGAALLGEDPLATLAQYPSERNFQIPALDNVLWRPIDRPGFSLSRFLLAPPADMSIVVRRALQVWIAQIFAQFQSFELRIAMESTDFLK